MGDGYEIHLTFGEGVSAAKNDLMSMYPPGTAKDGRCRNSETIRLDSIEKIERTVLGIVENATRGEFPSLDVFDRSDWRNCHYDDRLKIRENEVKRRRITFERVKGRFRFATLVFLLSKIHKLLTTGKTCTRRELYYRNLEMFKSQKQVDDGMRDVSQVLKVPSWELGVFATSKGLVSGPVVLEFQDGESLNCSKNDVVMIPANVSRVRRVSSSADWVLVVEKDTSFQRLMEGGAGLRLGSCIILTGKGFPDVGTRMLVCSLWDHLRIPVFVLSDADPYGFEIMCVYRFGSLVMSSHSDNLACPAVRWLGIHPGDIKPLLLDSKPLSARDVRKIHLMLNRCYVRENDTLRHQLNVFLSENLKAEIEGVSSISANYLVDVYIRNKIQCKEYY